MPVSRFLCEDARDVSEGVGQCPRRLFAEKFGIEERRCIRHRAGGASGPRGRHDDRVEQVLRYHRGGGEHEQQWYFFQHGGLKNVGVKNFLAFFCLPSELAPPSPFPVVAAVIMLVFGGYQPLTSRCALSASQPSASGRRSRERRAPARCLHKLPKSDPDNPFPLAQMPLPAPAGASHLPAR